jgi:uncharacterized membrane protein
MKKLKAWWLKHKEAIDMGAKYIIFTYAMTMGFWFTYCLIWITAGLPDNTWALWLLFIFAVISERLFIKWLNN